MQQATRRLCWDCRKADGCGGEQPFAARRGLYDAYANRKGSMRSYLAAVAVGALTLIGCHSNQNAQWSQESRASSLDTQPQGAHVWQIAAPSGSRVDLGMTPIVNE